MTTIPAQQTGRYACPVCPRRFTTLPNKKQHVKLKHPKPKA
jgi:hypothetical protein